MQLHLARKRMTVAGTEGEDIFIAVRLLFKLFRIAFASVAASAASVASAAVGPAQRLHDLAKFNKHQHQLLCRAVPASRFLLREELEPGSGVWSLELGVWRLVRG